MKTQIKPIDQRNLGRVAFTTANNILVSWGCSGVQIQTILKLQKANYYKFKSAPESARFSDDQLERVSYILNIHQALRIIFSNPENVTGFMSNKNHNEYFNGRTPLEVIESGLFSSLYEVFKRIDALRGGLWG
ncbi:MAG: DUF2384 domain-containing protein [Endozoicomonadaceae bacterium]|nr:DUF2384 domain-containing protein [Endozoicomonadaceae bacterium]